ncbi:hypothetical protein [Sarcina ventriculi]|uniref:Uncharacterized protein n=1 Tax=Sarcina ventriculi TaxID=1267 RepID=A0ABP2AWH2_SARVE|nr:hypothetical protein [Sarcina ventriculi]CUO25835.1 Uncharacterised protein [Sarcina ventriculi]
MNLLDKYTPTELAKKTIEDMEGSVAKIKSGIIKEKNKDGVE